MISLGLYGNCCFSNTQVYNLSLEVKKVNKFRSTKIHLFLLLVVTVVLIWSVIKPTGYMSWASELFRAVAGLIIIIAKYNKFSLTTNHANKCMFN